MCFQPLRGCHCLNQKEEEPDPARQEYPFFRTSLARIMDAQEGELLLVALVRRMHDPAVYLEERTFTHNLFVDWTMFQTSFPRRQVLAYLAVLKPKPSSRLGVVTFFQLTKCIPLLLKPRQIKFRVVWSILSQIF